MPTIEKFLPARLPASDFRTKAQLAGSENLARKLCRTSFNCCTFPDGTACTGAGKIVTEDGIEKIACGNHTVAVGRTQRPGLLTAEEAANCAKLSAEKKKEGKKKHHKTPPGS